MINLNTVVGYIKNHKFHVVLLILLVFASVAEIAQFKISAQNYLHITEAKNDLALLKQEIDSDRVKFTEKVNNIDTSINSRIDILDSSIKINDKRKILIKRIRDAIVENTTTELDVRTLNRIAIAVIDYSYTYNLSISWLLAQLKSESNFNPNAISSAGAMGLGQIMPDTHEYLVIKAKNPTLNPWDVNDNIFMTCFYMAELKTKFGSFETALQAYNAGPDTVRKVKAGQREFAKETLEYVPTIKKWNEVFKRYGLE